MKYRKKPVVIEAHQLQKDNLWEIARWMNGTLDWEEIEPDNFRIEIPTLEGNMKANFGDYIIKGVHGEFYPCKPDIFEKTYDKVNDECAA